MKMKPSAPCRIAVSEASSWLQDRRHAFDDVVARIEEYAVFTLTSAGAILDWNSGAERIFGHEASDVIGRHYACFFSEEEQRAGVPDAALAIAVAEGSFDGEGWRQRQDGEPFWGHITLAALRSRGGGMEGFVQITRDLTQRRMTMEALRLSEERFRLLVECVQGHAIFMLDPEGHVVSWNSGARRVKGYEEDEIIGRHFSVFYPPEEVDAGLPRELLALAWKEGKVEEEGWRVRKDGTRFLGHIVITAVFEPGGELRGFAKFTRDLSDRRQVETLREAGRRKDSFLAMLAHELRNPLAPILPGVDIILRCATDPEKVSEVAGMLRRQVEQMARLIEDLVDVSRFNTGKIELRKVRGPLAEVTERALEAVKPAIEAKQQLLSVDIPQDLHIEADPHRLAQVISNLLSNASKFTPPGGRISLSAEVARGEMLKIVVKDDGKGIEQEEIDSIFELFEQGGAEATGGLGIGLTLVRSLAELHGGEVSVRSQGTGAGSEFTVLLPVVIPVDVPARAGGRDGKRNEEVLRVVIADDGKSAADILGMFFRMEGMATRIAYDGDEAVAVARDFEPDVVFLDLGMPRLDGFDACRRIRSMYPHAVMVALTGWGSKEDRRRSADAGFDEHLIKPVGPEQLRQFFDRYFAAGKRRASAAMP